MQNILFSATSLAFYPAEWVVDGTYSSVPEDLVQLTEEELNLFFNSPKPEGKKIGSEKGRPIFVDIENNVVFTKDEIENFRASAYAHPITGSDKYFLESLSLQAEGYAASSSEVKAVKAQGISRKLEIQSAYPYPDNN